MMRWTSMCLAVGICAPGLVAAQDSAPRRHDALLQDVQRATWRRPTVHYGKWLTAGAAVALTAMAAHEHSRSRRDWNQLLDICRAADDACARRPDGRYVRPDAEALYQGALAYDRRANRRLFGAQASLLVTAALFILDLRPGDGPDDIPFAPLRVAIEPGRRGALLGVQVRF
jgi:hypothetical protein